MTHRLLLVRTERVRSELMGPGCLLILKISSLSQMHPLRQRVLEEWQQSLRQGQEEEDQPKQSESQL